MADLVFCYNCNLMREIKDLKKTESSIKGKCKKCGAIISKNISKKPVPVPPVSTPTQRPIITPIGLHYNQPIRPGEKKSPERIKGKIFVSYSRRDAGDFANQINMHLSSFNYDIFTDVDDIKAGEVWSNTIEENISTCDIFVVIVTYGALQSPHVKSEVLQAQNEKKTIIPCFHKSVVDSDIKWKLNEIQGVEFDDRHELARNLHSKLSNILIEV
jgi:hypothetical protein